VAQGEADECWRAMHDSTRQHDRQTNSIRSESRSRKRYISRVDRIEKTTTKTASKNPPTTTKTAPTDASSSTTTTSLKETSTAPTDASSSTTTTSLKGTSAAPTDASSSTTTTSLKKTSTAPTEASSSTITTSLEVTSIAPISSTTLETTTNGAATETFTSLVATPRIDVRAGYKDRIRKKARVEEETEMSFITLGSSPKPVSKRFTVTSGRSLNKADLACLEPGKWFTGAVINAYFESMYSKCAEQYHHTVFNKPAESDLWHFIVDGPVEYAARYFQNIQLVWQRLASPGDEGYLPSILMPILYKKHWTLLNGEEWYFGAL
jgi:hypothetical protein